MKLWLYFKLAFSVACLSLVAGCGDKPRIRTVVQTVEVAKPVFCKPEPVATRVYPIDSLTGAEDFDVKARAYAATVKVMLGEILELRAANGGATCPAI